MIAQMIAQQKNTQMIAQIAQQKNTQMIAQVIAQQKNTQMIAQVIAQQKSTQMIAQEKNTQVIAQEIAQERSTSPHLHPRRNYPLLATPLQKIHKRKKYQREIGEIDNRKIEYLRKIGIGNLRIEYLREIGEIDNLRIECLRKKFQKLDNQTTGYLREIEIDHNLKTQYQMGIGKLKRNQKRQGS
jgi:hypothetical protein